MTTFGSNERTLNPSEGQMYYVADQQGSDRTALNRHVNAAITDHADGITSTTGYSLDENLGYPWAQSSLPGLHVHSEGLAQTGTTR